MLGSMTLTNPQVNRWITVNLRGSLNHQAGDGDSISYVNEMS